MKKKSLMLAVSLLFLIGITGTAVAAKVPAPAKGGDGFTAVTLDQARKMIEDGATVIACHSHTTDFMKGHPDGTIHITCLVPKDHSAGRQVDVQANRV